MADMSPEKFLVTRRRLAWWCLAGLSIAYALVCALIFFQWVNPSLQGQTSQRIAADSSTYLYMADVLREGRNDPFVLGALASFPNTLWMPVFVALLLKNTVVIALVNVFVFLVSIRLFKLSSEFNVGLFVALLLINPTTMVSLLSVNKEIIDLFVVALFCYSLTSKRKWALCAALIIALLNRYEVCFTMILFLFIRSRLNPLRRRRLLTLFGLVVLISFCLPLLAGRSLATRFEEASSGGMIAFLDSLEMHYLYFIAVIPKILEGMFGELLNVSRWTQYSTDDLANSYILVFNNVAALVTLLILGWKRNLKLSSDWVYFALLGCIIMSLSLVVQPRYFYYCYVLFCFQAAHPRMLKTNKYVLKVRDFGGTIGIA
jgi:hypothetical protein